MADVECDVAVIGAGTAGLSAERAAREAGAKTLLIDPYFAGTVCANVGCMPSKLLIAAGNAAARARGAGVFGVHASPEIDGVAVMERVRAERDRFVAGAKKAIHERPEGVLIKSNAEFDGSDGLILDDGRRITAKAVVIATGSSPSVPGPFRDLEKPVLTNQTIFELPDLPKTLAVIGAGVIGVEIAQAMARLGVEVCVFDLSEKLGFVREDAVERAARQALAADVTLHLGTSPGPSVEDGQFRLRWGDNQSALFEHVLVATGRPPSVEGLGLETTGAELDKHGSPAYDKHTLQIGKLPIYIAGDANGDSPVLHEASAEGTIAGRNAARHGDPFRAERMPHFAITFTDPPVASVGLGPDAADFCGTSDYSDQGRAKVEARAHGVVRIYADKDARLIGADLCAPGGDHMAHLLLWAIIEKLPAQEVLRRPFYHPTLEEGLRQALREICSCSGKEDPADWAIGDAPGS